jgi:ABC-type amino acid transport system permease subunit
MTHKIGHVTKVQMDDLISGHIVGCNELAINWFVAKLCLLYNIPTILSIIYF